MEECCYGFDLVYAYPSTLSLIMIPLMFLYVVQLLF